MLSYYRERKKSTRRCNQFDEKPRDIRRKIQGGAKVITRCSFAVIFVMKNFGSACEMSLFNPLEFIPSSRENAITELTFDVICKSYNVFQ